MPYFEESLSIYRKIKNRSGIGYALHNVGGVHLQRGDYANAGELLRQSLAIRTETGETPEIATCHINLGIIALRLGEYKDGFSEFAQAIRLTNNHSYVAVSLDGLALLAAQSRQPERTAYLWGAAEGLSQVEDVTARLDPPELEIYNREYPEVGRQLGSEQFQRIFVAGIEDVRKRLDEVVEFAASGKDKVEANLLP